MPNSDATHPGGDEQSTATMIRIVLADDHPVVRRGLRLLLDEEPDFEVVAWCGLAAPAGTPDAVVTRWNELVNEALRDPKLREQISAMDYDARGGTAGEFAHFLASEMSRYRKLADDMGLAED